VTGVELPTGVSACPTLMGVSVLITPGGGLGAASNPGADVSQPGSSKAGFGKVLYVDPNDVYLGGFYE
jgi:hypothetical protein